MQPVILSIAGYDPSSGAGVTADIKTAAAHGCFAVTCITAVTVQTTMGVRRVEPMLGEIVSQTLYELAADFQVAAVRIGMLGSSEVAEAVAGFLEETKLANVVLDPIVRSSSGAALVETRGLDVIRKRILPLADVITPNLDEAAALIGKKVAVVEAMSAAGHELLDLGARNVVVTGGHLEGGRALDLLLWRDSASGQIFEEELGAEKIASKSTHGTGCAFATSIACHLARGYSLPDAVLRAKNFVLSAIEKAESLGHGHGPMALLWPLEKN
jgi:hydroxymethylpyrimidine/phosphomethylpyrimidine kinase